MRALGDEEFSKWQLSIGEKDGDVKINKDLLINCKESDHDAFGTGHASTSLSAGLGFAEADRSQGNGSYTVVVMGDGAFTGGMIHEALNNCHKDLRLILIINENEMSISKNIGQFAKQLARLRARPAYLKTKSFVGNALASVPLIGNQLKMQSVISKKRSRIRFTVAIILKI